MGKDRTKTKKELLETVDRISGYNVNLQSRIEGLEEEVVKLQERVKYQPTLEFLSLSWREAIAVIEKERDGKREMYEKMFKTMHLMAIALSKEK